MLDIISHIFVGDSYWVAAKNKNCPINGIVTTESECIQATAQLGLKYQNDLRANYNPPGCFTWLEGSRYTYFNGIIDPSSITSTDYRITAGICRSGSIDYLGMYVFVLEILF